MDIAEVKEIAEEFLFADWGDDIMDVAYDLGFDYGPDEVTIVNPWYDPTGRFELSDEEAIATYGKENVEGFIQRVRDYYEP